MHIIEFDFIFFISVSVLADMKCPHIGIGRYAFFAYQTMFASALPYPLGPVCHKTVG